jgi:hypothetical protein
VIAAPGDPVCAPPAAASFAPGALESRRGTRSAARPASTPCSGAWTEGSGRRVTVRRTDCRAARRPGASHEARSDGATRCQPAAEHVRRRPPRSRSRVDRCSHGRACAEGAHQCLRWFGCMSPHLYMQSLAHLRHSGLACAAGGRGQRVSARGLQEVLEPAWLRFYARRARRSPPHWTAAPRRRVRRARAGCRSAAAPRCAARHWSGSCRRRCERCPPRDVLPQAPLTRALPRWANSCPSRRLRRGARESSSHITSVRHWFASPRAALFAAGSGLRNNEVWHV